MAYCRCGIFGFVLGFLIMVCVAQDATNGNENSIEEEGMIENVFNNTVYSNISTRLRNDVIEKTKPTVDTYTSTVLDTNSTDSRDKTSSFIELNNTTSNDSEYIKEHHETSRSVDLEFTTSANPDEQTSTTEFTTPITTNSDVKELSRTVTDLGDFLNVSTSEAPTIDVFNISAVNNVNEATSSSTPFMNTAENKSTKFTEEGMTESYELFPDSKSTDRAFPSTTNVTATSLLNESLANSYSEVFSSSEPSLRDSNDSNIFATKGTTATYDIMENTTSNASSISVTLGMFSSSSSLSEETIAELSTTTEPLVDAQTPTTASTIVESSTTDNSTSTSSGDVKTWSQFGETNVSVIFTESTTSEMQDSSTNSLLFKLTSEFSSHVKNETDSPELFGDTNDTKSSTDVEMGTSQSESHRITSTPEPYVNLRNGSDQTTFSDTVESSETVSPIDRIATASGNQTGVASESSLNVTDGDVFFTSSFMLNSTTENLATSTYAVDSYNSTSEHSSWSITDGNENVTKLTIPIIFNATYSTPDNVINSTGSDDSYTFTSYSSDTFNSTGKDGYSTENSFNTTIDELTESSITTITTSVSDFVSEYNSSVLTSTTSGPSTYDGAGFPSTNTTDSFSTGGKQPAIGSSSEASPSITQSITQSFSTTAKESPSSERTETSTSSSYSETSSSPTSTVATPIDVTEKVTKCLANLTEMEPGSTVTVVFSPMRVQDVASLDSYEIRFQQSVLSCLDVKMESGEKSEEGYSSISVEDREASLRSKSISCMSSPSVSNGEALFITFYIRQIINGSVPASAIAKSLKSCKSKIEQDVGLNVTNIFENIQIATLPTKEDISHESILQRHASLILVFSLVFGVLLIFGTVAFVYFYCCRNSRHYDTEKKKLKDMSASVEIGDMVPANEILNGETGEKEMFGLVNGSSSHLIKMDDDGWVVPYSEIPLEETNPPDVQDTKL